MHSSKIYLLALSEFKHQLGQQKYMYICIPLLLIVTLYILLLFATLYGKIHYFSMERCVQWTGMNEALYSVKRAHLSLIPQKKPSPIISEMEPPKKTLFPGKFPLSVH